MVFGFGYGHLAWDRMGVLVFFRSRDIFGGWRAVDRFLIISLVVFFGLVLPGLGMGLVPAELVYLLAL